VIVLAGLGMAGVPQRRRSPLAIPCLLAASLMSILVALWLLASPQPPILLPILALAVVLAYPAAALDLIVLAAGFTLVLLAAGPLAFLPEDRLIETAVASLLAVATAWTFGRGLVTAVEWSTASNTTAWKKTEEARRHRAELVLALEQLDIANQRLSRQNVALKLAWKVAEDAE